MPRLVSFALAGIALGMLSLTIRAADLIPLGDSIQPVGQSVRQQALTPEEGKAPLSFEVALKMRNFSDFQARVARGEHISPEELAERYQPRTADYQAVVDWLTGNGLFITRRDSHHLSIFARGEIGSIARVFDMQFARITLHGKTYTGAITPPRVPAKIAPLLRGINGLQPWHGRH